MNTIDKVLYTAKTHTTGGRDGASRTSDVQAPADRARRSREERLGQTPAGPAVRPGPCRARTLTPRHAVGVQAGDGGPARVVGAEDLPEEHPQGDERGEDPIQPAADRGQCLRQELVGEDVGERQPAVLEELVPQEGRLSAERPGVGVPH